MHYQLKDIKFGLGLTQYQTQYNFLLLSDKKLSDNLVYTL